MKRYVYHVGGHWRCETTDGTTITYQDIDEDTALGLWVDEMSDRYADQPAAAPPCPRDDERQP